MSEGVIILVISIALAIPLAIAANLLTPIVSEKLYKSRKKSRQKSIKKICEEYSIVEKYHQHRDEMYVGMTVAFLKVSVVSSIGTLIASLFNTGGLYFVASPIVALSTVIAVNIAFEALRTANRVRDFAEYRADVVKRLQDMGQDESVLLAEE